VVVTVLLLRCNFFRLFLRVSCVCVPFGVDCAYSLSLKFKLLRIPFVIQCARVCLYLLNLFNLTVLVGKCLSCSDLSLFWKILYICGSLWHRGRIG